MTRATDGDTSALCEPEALTEAAAALAELAGPDGPRVEVLRTVGTLHLMRRFALSSVDSEQAVRSAALAFTYLSPVFVVDPDSLVPVFVDELHETDSADRLRRRAPAGDVGRLADFVEAMLPVYLETRDPALLSWSVNALQDCVDAPDDGFRPGYLRALAFALQVRSIYGRSADKDSDKDDRRALVALTEAARTLPVGDPERPWLLVELAEATAANAVIERPAERVAEANALLAEALDAVRLDPSHYTGMADKVAAVRRIIDALGPQPSPDPTQLPAQPTAPPSPEPETPADRAAALFDRAMAAVDRFRDSGDPADAVAAIHDLAAIPALSQDERITSPMLSEIVALVPAVDAYEVDADTLRHLIDLLFTLTDLLGRPHPDYPEAMTILALMLDIWHRRWPDDDVADRAVETARTAVAATEDTDVQLPRRLYLLGLMLVHKGGFGQTRAELGTLEESIDVLEDALDLTSEGSTLHQAVFDAFTAARGRFTFASHQRS